MTTYRIKDRVRHQAHTSALGGVDVSFEPGEVTPKSEHEEYALEKLVEEGLAERVEPRKKKE